MNDEPQPVLSATTDGGERIVLRPAEMRDLDAIVETCRDPGTLEWTTVPLEYDRDKAVSYVEDYNPGWWKRGDGAAWVIADAEGDYVGQIDLRVNAGDPRLADVGFMTAPWARGKGYMSAALRAAVRFGFAELGLERIEWRANVGNEGSRRVAEKAGFVYEGMLRKGSPHRGERLDTWLAAIVKSDLP